MFLIFMCLDAIVGYVGLLDGAPWGRLDQRLINFLLFSVIRSLSIGLPRVVTPQNSTQTSHEWLFPSTDYASVMPEAKQYGTYAPDTGSVPAYSEPSAPSTEVPQPPKIGHQQQPYASGYAPPLGPGGSPLPLMALAVWARTVAPSTCCWPL
jgi:hypothetical protein